MGVHPSLPHLQNDKGGNRRHCRGDCIGGVCVFMFVFLSMYSCVFALAGYSPQVACVYHQGEHVYTFTPVCMCVSVPCLCVCVCVRWFSLWYSRANGLFTSSQISGGIYSPCVGRRGQGGRIYSQEQSSSSFLVWFSPLTPLSLSSYTPLMLYSVSLLLFLPPIYSFPHNVFALSHLLSLLPTKYLLSHCLPP